MDSLLPRPSPTSSIWLLAISKYGKGSLGDLVTCMMSVRQRYAPWGEGGRRCPKEGHKGLLPSKGWRLLNMQESINTTNCSGCWEWVEAEFKILCLGNTPHVFTLCLPADIIHATKFAHCNNQKLIGELVVMFVSTASTDTDS